MTFLKYLRSRHAHALLFCLIGLAGGSRAVAGDDSQFISATIPNGTVMQPRSIFTQTWTMKNTGTTIWTATYTNYTMNLVGLDSMGAFPPVAKLFSSHTLSTPIVSGASVPPGGTAAFTMNFIAPETPGPVTDVFQMNNTNSVFFGVTNTFQIVVADVGSTNQYDRARVVSYANNYCGYVNSDGYFWTNSSTYGTFTPLSPAPTSGLGDDCAHFSSSCIGSEPNVRGGGLVIPGRVPPTYGEPGAAHLVNTTLIAPGYAVEVFSLTNMEPGDLVGWNWSNDTNVVDLNHVTVYLGNGLLASHSASALDVSADTWYQSTQPKAVRHLIHIYDSPVLASYKSGKNMVLSWRTNWAAYTLYSSTNLGTWTKVSKSAVVSGQTNSITDTMTTGKTFYRLMMP